MDEKMLRAEEVAMRYGVSAGTIHSWGRGYTKPQFPKPVLIAQSVKRWRLSDLEKYEAELRKSIILRTMK